MDKEGKRGNWQRVEERPEKKGEDEKAKVEEQTCERKGRKGKKREQWETQINRTVRSKHEDSLTQT